MHARTTDFVALPLPRRTQQAAADPEASSTAPGGPDLEIEAARTHGPTISTGVVAVFVRFSPPSTRCVAADVIWYEYGVCDYGMAFAFACRLLILVLIIRL